MLQAIIEMLFYKSTLIYVQENNLTLRQSMGISSKVVIDRINDLPNNTKINNTETELTQPNWYRIY